MRIIRNIVLLMSLSLFVMGCQSKGLQNSAEVAEPSTQTDAAKSSTDITTATKIAPAPAPISQQDLEICMEITNGKILVADLPKSPPSRNNFYLECTLNPFIGTVKVTPSDRDRVRAMQSKNIAYLSGQDIDPHYDTTYGTRLLHTVIVSNLSEGEKMSWVQRMVEAGADVNYMNEYGNEALRAAEYKNLPRIYDWLVEKGAKP